MMPSRIAISSTRNRAGAAAGLIAALAAMVCPGAAHAQQKRASELIHKQPGPVVTARLANKINPDNSSVLISLSKQRVYLMVGDEIYLDAPISSGKRAGMTPTGNFQVSEKDKNHSSNIYGNFVDSRGRIVRGGVSARIDSAPSGTHFQGAPMKYFMRITDAGVGMHVGILPGYPASHGCIRLHEPVAEMIYNKVKIGTPVKVVE